MISITDIENRLQQKEQGKFQKICNEILKSEGYITLDRTGSEAGTEKTIPGTPDSVFIKDDNYIFVEFTTYQKAKLPQKIRDDVEKCFKLIDSDGLKDKISDIIFMHNRKQPSLKVINEIKQKCNKRNIKFAIYGIDYISDIIQRKYPYIAEKELELKDYDKLLQIPEKEIRKSLQNEIKNDDLEKITNRVSHLYEEASKITNNPTSLIYISNKNKKILDNTYSELISLEYIYAEKNNEESKNYYHNVLIILQRYNRKKYIEKFKEVEKYGILTSEDYNFYAENLIMENQENEALPILERIYYKEKNEYSFLNLIKCYFSLKQYNKVVDELSPLCNEKYDALGIMATFLLLSKNFIKKLRASDIVSYNKKFKNMPLYYTCTAQLLFKLNNKKYISQFKKALKSVKDDDYNTINIICDVAIEIKEAQAIIGYLFKLNLQNELIKLRLAKLLEYKKVLEKKEIKYLQDNINFLEENDIDINYLQGIINENKGFVIKSLTNYKNSYIKTYNNQSLSKYVILSIKQKNKIDLTIFPKINEVVDYQLAMVIAKAYKYMGDIDKAVEMSYYSLYLLSNYFDKEPYKQFWSIIMMYGNKLPKKNDRNSLKDNVLVLKDISNNKVKKYIVDDGVIYKENSKIADLIIIKSNNKIALEILGKKVNNNVIIENKTYKILKIEEKYKYLTRYCFDIVKDEKGIQIFTSTSENDDTLEQISKTLSNISKSMDNKLNIYEEKKLPLSTLISTEYNFEEYAKLINTLLSTNHLLYAGETISLNLDNGFVLDITSLITLTLLDKLDTLSDNMCKKIYISKSLKNKFDHFFENLISAYNEKEATIGYDESVNNKYNLVFQEIPNKNKMQLWRKLNSYINKFNILDIEFELDNMVNYQTLKLLDKVQFDLIKIAQDKNIPLICDDLFIRKICNTYKVSHTNTNFLINYNVSEFGDYMNNLITLAKYNYIYSIYSNECESIISYLLDNFNEDNKNLFIILINQLLSNDKSKKTYQPFLTNIMNNYEKLKYVKIFGEIFENKLATFIYDTIKKNL